MSDEIERLLSEVSRRPNDSELQQRLGRAYIAQQDYTAAKSAFARAITLAPRDPWNYLYAGNAAYSLDDHDEALEYFEAARRFAPRLDIVWVCIADCHAAEGRFATASSCYQAALDLEPNSELAHRRLGKFRRWLRSNT